MIKSRYAIALSLLFSLPSLYAGVIPGDAPSNLHTTVINAIGTFVFDIVPDYERIGLFVGASQAVADNNFAVAHLTRDQEKLVPLTPAKAFVDNDSAINVNPLHGQGILRLAHLNGKPAVITQAENNKVYVIRNNDGTSLLSTPKLLDMDKNESGQIIALEGIRGPAGSFFAAAIASHGSNQLGAKGGITLIAPALQKDGLKLEILEAYNTNPDNTTQESNMPSPINVSTDALKIGSDLSSLEITDMYWDQSLSKLFVAFNGIAGNNATDGVRGVAIAQIVGKKIKLVAIAPDSAFNANNQIIGSVGAGSAVSIAKIRTMHASTKSSYLIAVGGNGLPGTVGNTVYALPLVSDIRAQGQGLLAKATISPKNFRAFNTLATQPNDVLTTADEAARVGGGNLPIDSHLMISDIVVVGDVVYVAINEAYSNSTEPGIWASQAIIDNNGSLISWTPWARAAGIVDPVLGVQFDRLRATFWSLTGKTNTTTDTIRRTDWGAQQNNLLAGTFDNQNVGLTHIVSYADDTLSETQGVFDFSRFTSGLQNVSLMVSTSTNRVVIAETGRNTGGGFIPHTGDFSLALTRSQDGSLPSSTNGRVAIIEGGALKDLGPITAASIVSNGSIHWLIVGGTNGLAILADNNGIGWQGTIQSLADMANNNPTFKRIDMKGMFNSTIRLLKSSSDNIFVMTYKQLGRIVITPQDILEGTTSALVVASLQDLGAEQHNVFNDVYISGPLALLATGRGLFRTGNGFNIQQATTGNDVGWTPVFIPEGNGPVQQIFPVASSIGIVPHTDLYILSAYRGLDKAQVNRFFVRNVAQTNNIITDETVSAFKSDYFALNKPSYFVDYGYFTDSIFSTGAILLNMHSRDYRFEAFIGLLGARLYSEVIFMAFNQSHIAKAINITTEQTLGPITYNSASGSLFYWGDGGLRVTE